MNLKKIGSFCRANKRVLIINHASSGSTWIGDGHGMWLCDEGVVINEHNYAALLDIEEKDTKAMNVTNTYNDEGPYDGNLETDWESMEVLGCGVLRGEYYLALRDDTTEKLALIKMEYAAAATKKEEYRRYYMAALYGTPVVIVTDGMNKKMIVAIEGYKKTEEFSEMAYRIGRMEPILKETEEAEQTEMDEQ